MPTQNSGLVASLTAGISARLHDVAGNAAILGIVALLALTVWITCLAGVIAVLAPLWGIPLAIFSVALLLAVTALILLAVLRRRTRLQEARATRRHAETRRKGREALLSALPGLVRSRPGALLIGSGLMIGALIIAALQTEDEDEVDAG